MWYAFWIVSIALAAGVIILYAIKREKEEETKKPSTRTSSSITPSQPIASSQPIRPFATSLDQKSNVPPVRALNIEKNSSTVKSFSADTLPSFLKAQPETPSKTPPKGRTPRIPRKSGPTKSTSLGAPPTGRTPVSSASAHVSANASPAASQEASSQAASSASNTSLRVRTPRKPRPVRSSQASPKR